MSASPHNKSRQTEELSLWEERETLARLNHTLQSDIHHLIQKLTTEHQEYKQRVTRLNEEIGQLKEDLHKERENSMKAKRQYKEIDAQNKRTMQICEESYGKL